MSRDFVASFIAEHLSEIRRLGEMERGGKNARPVAARVRGQLVDAGVEEGLAPALGHFLTVSRTASGSMFKALWQERYDERRKKASCREELDKKAPGFSDRLLAAPAMDLGVLPPYSWFISFRFTLEQSYISRDEAGLSVTDNPIRTNRVFGLPEVASTSWKGSLRSSLWKLGHREDDPAICRLLGTLGNEDTGDGGRAGRLRFFSTFFDKSGLEVINLQDRKKRSGTIPVTLECVPAGAQGVFALLYVPFDVVGTEWSECRLQVAEDLALAAQGVHAMLSLYGFGAKVTSGHGLAQADVHDGQLGLNAALSVRAVSEGAGGWTLPGWLEADGRLKEKYRKPDGSFREYSAEEMKAQGWSQDDRREYKRAQRWWEKQQQAHRTLHPAPASVPRFQRAFASLDELVDLTSAMATALREAAV